MEAIQILAEEKRKELQARFDKMLNIGCNLCVIDHELIDGITITCSNYQLNPTKFRGVSFTPDLLHVMRTVPVLDANCNIVNWRFRLYYRPCGWHDNSHSHHVLEVYDFTYKAWCWPQDSTDDGTYIYMIGEHGRSISLQAFDPESCEEDELVYRETFRNYLAYKNSPEKKAYFEELEKEALRQEYACMKMDDSLKGAAV